MKHGFIKVAAVTPKIQVADVQFNTKAIIDKITEAYGQGARIMVLPELCITGYSCQDLFMQENLQEGALDGLRCSMECPCIFNNIFNICELWSPSEYFSCFFI